MFMFIKYAEDKEALAHIKELSGCDKVDEDTFDTLVNYINEPRLLEWKKEIKNEEGVVNMCKGIDDLIEDGKREGKIVSELWTIRNPGDVRFPGVFCWSFWREWINFHPYNSLHQWRSPASFPSARPPDWRSR